MNPSHLGSCVHGLEGGGQEFHQRHRNIGTVGRAMLEAKCLCPPLHHPDHLLMALLPAFAAPTQPIPCTSCQDFSGPSLNAACLMIQRIKEHYSLIRRALARP